MDYDPASIPCPDPLYYSAAAHVPSWVLSAVYLVVSAIIIWRCIRSLTMPRIVTSIVTLVVVNMILVVPGYLLHYVFDKTAITEMTYWGTYGAALIVLLIAFAIYHVVDRVWGDGGASDQELKAALPSPDSQHRPVS